MTTSTKTHAILTIDGHFAGQAHLDDNQSTALLKHDAREARNDGRTVTLRKGPYNPHPTAQCQCGATVHLQVEKKGNAHYNMGEHYPSECSECGASEGSANCRLNTVYSWITPAQQEAAQDWYDAQEFGFDGGF
jgi:hypothetical protein